TSPLRGEVTLRHILRLFLHQARGKELRSVRYCLNLTTSGAGPDSAITSPLLLTVTLYMPTSFTSSAGTTASSSLRLTNLVASSCPLSRTRWNGQKPLPCTLSVVGPSPCVIMSGDTSIVCDSCCHELNSGIGFT